MTLLNMGRRRGDMFDRIVVEMSGAGVGVGYSILSPSRAVLAFQGPWSGDGGFDLLSLSRRRWERRRCLC